MHTQWQRLVPFDQVTNLEFSTEAQVIINDYLLFVFVIISSLFSVRKNAAMAATKCEKESLILS